jgi:hypothetical protein
MYFLDLNEKALVLRVDVHQGTLLHYKVSFLGLTAFHLDCQHATPWERIELTDLMITKSEKGWVIEINIWDSGNLRISCADIIVNGAELR